MKKKFLLAASTTLMAALPFHAQGQTRPDATAPSAPPSEARSDESTPPAAPQSATSSQDADGLADIVVTAQRREQNLQRVPVAVTALSTEALDQARVTNIERLSGFAPNLLVTEQSASATPVVTLRGINSGSSNVAQDPKLAVYLDGVYVGRNTGSIFDLADIERVEVLRGPQGTLFGRNATAGAISLVTAAPSGKLDGKVLLSYGNYNAFRGRVVLNLPKVGPLSVKLAYLHNQIDGDVRNLIGGQALDARARAAGFGPFTFAKRLGSVNQDAFQGKARLDLGDFTADYSYDITDAKYASRASQVITTIDDGGAGSLVAGILGFQTANPSIGYGGTGGITNLATGPQDALASGSSVSRITVGGHSVTLTYNPAPNVVIKNITAWRFLNERPFLNDIVGSGGLRFSAAQLGSLLTGDFAGIFAPAAQPGPNDRFYSILAGETFRQHQFSEEFQVNYTGSLLDVTAGLFYFSERGTQTNLLGIFEAVPNGVNTPSPLDAVFGTGATNFIARNRSYAGYAQATVHITPKVDLTGGIRYTEDKRELQRQVVSTAAAAGTTPFSYNESKFTRTNYTAILSYRPTDRITSYAKFSTGYVAGGIYNGVRYNPESLQSYELGLKVQMLDNRLRANIAAFYENYTDLQVQDNVNGVVFVTNAGSARIPGIEAEITAVPVRGLTLSGNLGYQDFKYKRYIQNIGGVPTDVADVSRPLYSANLTLQLAAQYDMAEFANGARPYLRVDGRYRSKGYISANPVGATQAERDRIEPLATIRPFWLVDARAGITKLPIGRSGVDVSVYAQNVFNVRRYDFGAPILALVGAYNRPRTYGIELNARF
jgi:iron complex outermembrane receptor protein